MRTSYLGEIPNLTLRDFQSQKLYHAEAFCSFWNNLTILSSSKVKGIVKDISLWANVNFPKLFLPTLKNDRNTSYSTASEIVLQSPLAQSVPFICHEMSHVINYQRGPADHHGPNFATAYLEVVNKFVGSQEYEELKESFDIHKVKYKEVIHI